MVLHNKEDYMKTTALIMAGGKGERFWPKAMAQSGKTYEEILAMFYWNCQLAKKY